MNSKLESLPNEILVECFEYLDGSDILFGFNRLNQRFNKLIHHIRFYIDFRQIRKLFFNQILDILFSNDDIKQQIYSIKLSNRDTNLQIESFFNRFSLQQFSNLRSLTFIDISQNTLFNLLPLPLSIVCLHLYNKDEWIRIDKIKLTQFQILTLPILRSRINYDLLNVQKLTIFQCTAFIFCQILETSVQLKYLNVEIIHSNLSYLFVKYYSYSEKCCAVHLKKLNIKLSSVFQFRFIEFISKLTPNLNNLIISQNNCHKSMLIASNWQKLITTSLPYLKIFQMYFKYSDTIEYNNHNLEQFQTNFWQNEHKWFIEYAISKSTIELYTVPFTFDQYKLPLHTIRYYTDQMNSFETFVNVEQLTVEAVLTRENFQYYFPCVTSLSLGDSLSRNYNIRRSIDRYIDSLKMIINLSNIKHLSINSNSFNNSKILSQILQQMPNLNFLSMNFTLLQCLIQNDKSFEYINKLKINGSIFNFEQFEKHKWIIFCKIFSNIEYLICEFMSEEIFVFLLNNLPNLLRVNLCLGDDTSRDWIKNLKEKSQLFGVDIIITNDDLFVEEEVSIWILRKTL